jgi:type VI protein secretion system component VasK
MQPLRIGGAAPMLRDILLSYGVLFGFAVIAFLTATAFGHGLRLERQALQEAYRALQALMDEPSPQTDLPSHQRVGISA